MIDLRPVEARDTAPTGRAAQSRVVAVNDPGVEIRGLEDRLCLLAPLLGAVGHRVLEIGAGAVTRHYLPPAAEHFVLDPSPVLRSRPTALVGYFPGLRRPSTFVRGAVGALPFVNGCVDAVVAVEDSGHLALQEALGEAARVLRPGGVVALLGEAVERERLAAGGGLRVLRTGPLGRWHFTLAERVSLDTGDTDPRGIAPGRPVRRRTEVTDVTRIAAAGRASIRGHIDRPRPEDRVAGATVEIVGWALGTGPSIVRVEARVGGRPVRATPIGLPRPDLAEAFPDVADAADGGFRMLVPLLDIARDGTIEIVAVAADGGRRTIGAVHARALWEETTDPDELGLAHRVSSTASSLARWTP